MVLRLARRLAVFVVPAAVVIAYAAPAIAIADTTAPTVVSVNGLSQDVVDTRQGPQAVTLTAHLVDPGSGVQSFEPVFTGPDDQQWVPDAYELTSGTEMDGVWTATILVPQFNATGIWRLTAITVADQAGNGRTITTLLPSLPITVVSATDTTAPAVVDVHVVSAGVDTTQGPSHADLAIHVTDAGAGVSSLKATFTRPDGRTLDATSASFTTGNANDGTIALQVDVPQYNASGTWTLSELTIADVLGNVSTITDDTDAPSFTVSSGTDVTPPTASALTLDRSAVDVTAQSAQVTVSLTADGTGSPIFTSRFTMTSPAGTTVIGYANGVSASGGPMTARLTIPRWAAAGTWVLTGLTLQDTAGNTRTYTADDLPFSAPTIAVTDASPDVSAPSVSDLTVAPQTVDVSGGATGTVTVSFRATDDVSGVQFANVRALGPGGEEVTGNAHRLGGTANDGTYTATLTLPGTSGNGTWTLDQVEVSDAAPNTTASLAQPRHFTVSGGTNEPPCCATPRAVGSNASAVVTWDPVRWSGSSAVTGYQVRYASGSSDWTTVSVSDTHTTLKGLVNGQAYSVEVAAANAAGLGPWLATTVTPQPITPDAPAAPTGRAGDGSVTLSISPPDSDGGSPVTGTLVRWSRDAGTTWSAPVAASASPIGGLLNGTAYVFQVAATNAVGTSGWSAASNPVTPATTPGAPRDVSATAGNATAVLSWAAPSVNGGAVVNGYAFRYSTSGGTAWSAPIPLNSTGIIGGLVNNATYVFQVAARNAVGLGDWSPSTAPATPTKSAVSVSVAAPGWLTSGDHVTVRGTLASVGTPLPGAAATLWARPLDATAWVPVASTVSSTNGLLTATAAPLVRTAYQWRYRGDATHIATISSVVQPRVHPTVPIGLTSRTVRVGTRVSLFGVWAPRVTGTKVVLQRWTGTGWQTAATALTKKQVLPNGRTAIGYTFQLKPSRRGSSSYRLVTIGDTLLAAGTSNTVTLVVR